MIFFIRDSILKFLKIQPNKKKQSSNREIAVTHYENNLKEWRFKKTAVDFHCREISQKVAPRSTTLEWRFFNEFFLVAFNVITVRRRTDRLICRVFSSQSQLFVPNGFYALVFPIHRIHFNNNFSKKSNTENQSRKEKKNLLGFVSFCFKQC